MSTPHQPTPTSLERELEEQRRWILQPQYAGGKVFDTLIRNEFIPEDEHQRRQGVRAWNLLRFSLNRVPYYQRLFKELGLGLEDFKQLSDLGKLPILSKEIVQEHGNALLPTSLPEGEKIVSKVKTSGSTGQPLTLYTTRRSNFFFQFLRQRSYRWYRWDPKQVLGALRPGDDLPPGKDGKRLELGETCHLAGWHGFGPIFRTGPFYGYLRANPIDDQIAWLEKHQVSYLIAQAADMEQLALAHQKKLVPDSLKSIIVISQELPEDMEALIEKKLKVPVQIGYGLNEIGIVANRCPEGKRYHVHAEHCIVEIVDENGQPCKPGECGRIVVTGLNNLASPLFRYDTDDLAEVVEGPCPCGRSLPSFGRIYGRYRRLSSLPPGTMDYFRAVMLSLSDMDQNLMEDLRQYQLHQSRDGHFTLRVVATSPMPQAFGEFIMGNWNHVETDDSKRLEILEVDHIPRPQGGKYQNFTSDFMPNPSESRD